MTNDELLEMVSKLSTELLETKKQLSEQESASKGKQRLLDTIGEDLDKAEVPRMHVVNRVEWLIERVPRGKVG